MPENSQEFEDNNSLLNKKFGRIKSPPDRRDWSLNWFMPEKKITPIKERKWDFPLDPLDQGNSSHCVGFSMASFGICLPTFTPYTNEDGHKFYYMCKEIDGFPEKENGTTLRSGAKVLQDIGAINNYAFARDIDSIKWWVLNRGPVIIGTSWTDKMMLPDESGILNIEGFIIGGHAYDIIEWREDDYAGIINSWGKKWGKDGMAYIHKDDLEAIFSYDGEAIAAVELENYKKKKENWLVAFIKKILKVLFGA